MASPAYDTHLDGTKHVLDLFSGLGGFSQAFVDHPEWTVTTVDSAARFDPDIEADIHEIAPAALPDADVVVASPPCTAFSVAAIGHYWQKRDTDGATYVPTREACVDAIRLIYRTLYLIDHIAPTYWFVENPRGMLRKLLGPPQGTVTWCQYGADRMKPTDLWGDHPDDFTYRRCTTGADCHTPAPRGSQTGTQGIDTPAERAKIPYGLSEAVLAAIE